MAVAAAIRHRSVLENAASNCIVLASALTVLFYLRERPLSNSIPSRPLPFSASA